MLLFAQGEGGVLNSPAFYAVILVLVLMGVAFFGIMFLIYGKLWFQAYMSQADISPMSLVFMGFRQVNSSTIVNAKIMSAQAGLSIDRRDGISTDRLEAHYLAGGNVNGRDSCHRRGPTGRH